MKNATLLSLSFFLTTMLFAQKIPKYEIYSGESLCDTDNWKLVYQDEFNGTSLDTNTWATYFPYDGKLGDKCLYCRTHNQKTSQQVVKDENVVVDNGILRIIQKKEKATWYGVTKDYSSGVIYSKIHFDTYSKFEIRCKLPKGMGLWSAFWTFGGPTEIDVFEITGDKPAKVHQTLHRNYYNLKKRWWRKKTTVKKMNHGVYNGVDYTADFHVFAVEYDKYFINWLIDGEVVRTVGRYRKLEECDAPLKKKKQRREKAFPKDNKWLNVTAGVAVATDDCPFTKAPNAETVFPSELAIDYIRVYQRKPQKGRYNLCPNEISGSEVLYEGNEYSYQYNGVNIKVQKWEVSPNLKIIRNEGNAVVVAPQNITEPVKGWIRAVFAGDDACNTAFEKNISLQKNKD